ncbi:hypothetical protein CB1_000294010 [Camelus ferus]|nr:hypothetical protein CB1_000294010 [Camelus ferus]
MENKTLMDDGRQVLVAQKEASTEVTRVQEEPKATQPPPLSKALGSILGCRSVAGRQAPGRQVRKAGSTGGLRSLRGGQAVVHADTKRFDHIHKDCGPSPTVPSPPPRRLSSEDRGFRGLRKRLTGASVCLASRRQNDALFQPLCALGARSVGLGPPPALRVLAACWLPPVSGTQPLPGPCLRNEAPGPARGHATSPYAAHCVVWKISPHTGVELALLSRDGSSRNSTSIVIRKGYDTNDGESQAKSCYRYVGFNY